MYCQILKAELKSPNKFKSKISEFVRDTIEKHKNIKFNIEEISELLLSACRMNEFDILEIVETKCFLNEDKAERWINERLLPNTVVMDFNDEDIIRLLLFCFEITYKMFEGGTKATVTAKGFRERRRTFESIVVDQFNGKLGEILLKRFLESKFKNISLELDWEISRDIEKYKNDIINATKNISIKSTNSLAGIWAEADKGYDYGIMVKCAVPEPVILQFFVEVCGFSKLLNFADSRIPTNDERFKDYIERIRERIISYKCGEMVSLIKGFICGFFKTEEIEIARLGESREYLGKVREERYLLQIRDLKYKDNDWKNFLKDVGLVNFS